MPSAIETATEHARTVPEERPFLTDEAPPAPEDRQAGERMPALASLDRSFWAGVSDAFANGWPPRR